MPINIFLLDASECVDASECEKRLCSCLNQALQHLYIFVYISSNLIFYPGFHMLALLRWLIATT